MSKHDLAAFKFTPIAAVSLSVALILRALRQRSRLIKRLTQYIYFGESNPWQRFCVRSSDTVSWSSWCA